MRQSNRLFAGLLIGILILLLDLFTKHWVQSHIPLMTYSNHVFYPYDGIGVFRNLFGIEFSIIHATNTGAAYGLFANFQLPLLVIRIILIVGMFIYLLFFNKIKEFTIPFALIITGALGNVIDYFLYGHVVDMFHFVLWGYDCPIFNVADSAITIGIFWMFYLSFKQGPQHESQ